MYVWWLSLVVAGVDALIATWVDVIFMVVRIDVVSKDWWREELLATFEDSNYCVVSVAVAGLVIWLWGRESSLF